MSEFLQRVEAVVTRRRLLPRGKKILVAVSGGADSMVLLSVLNSLAKQNRWKLSVAHFNHQLRGRASAADEKLVGRTAKKLSLPFFCERADVAGFARRSKISVEMAARKLRHEFLARTARRQKIPTIALAHHADDQVELFFLRLLRGAGGEGLAGMKWCSPSPAAKAVSLIRPLLDFSKPELLEFAREAKIKFREDATNASSDFLRNRIRNKLLPLLEKNYQPGLTKAVLRLMEIVGAEAEFSSEAASLWLGGLKGDFEKLPVAVQRKVLQAQLIRLGVASDFELIEQLREAAGKFVSISAGLAIARNQDGKLVRRELRRNHFSAVERNLKLSGRAGRFEFGGHGFRWHFQQQKQFRLRRQTAGIEFFDADQVGAEIVLRHWRAGDRFQPIGLSAPAKLQDLFTNAKIPRDWRGGLIVATTKAGEIFWVEGLRMAERFKLKPETKRRLVWRWRLP